MVTEKGEKPPPGVDASGLNASDGKAEYLPAGLQSRMVRGGTRNFFFFKCNSLPYFSSPMFFT